MKLPREQKRTISLISFISISIAWTLGFTSISIIDVITLGETDDLGVVIFWSAFFVLIAWVLAIRLPLFKINPSSLLFSRIVFPFISLFYANITFTLLIGWAFIGIGGWSLSLWIMASIIGLVFGICYSQFMKSPKLIDLIKANGLVRYLFLLFPILYCTLSLYLFPLIAPSSAFRFMPDSIRHKIIMKTIVQYQEGDSFKELQDQLPGYFSVKELQDHGQTTWLGGFKFSLKVKNSIITELKIEE